MDIPLLLLIALLLLTLTAFFGGWLPYPLGAVVLVLLIIARLLHLRNRSRL